MSKILYLRQNYHFGPRKIADYLKRFHRVSVAGATVHRILIKHDVNRLPANQKYRQHAKRWKRYEKPQPGHRLQMDVKFLERIPGTRKRLYQFTAIDDCTRIRVLKIYDACTQANAIRFADAPAAHRAGWTDALRTATSEDESANVTSCLRPYRFGVTPRGSPLSRACFVS